MSTRRTSKFFKGCMDEGAKFDALLRSYTHYSHEIGKVESITEDANGITIKCSLNKKPRRIGDDEVLIPSEWYDILREGEKLHEAAEKNANITAMPKEVVVLKCSTCGHMFEPVKELHYIATEVSNGMFSPETTEYWDAYDCPRCGTQKLVSERKAKMEISE